MRIRIGRISDGGIRVVVILAIFLVVLDKRVGHDEFAHVGFLEVYAAGERTCITATHFLLIYL